MKQIYTFEFGSMPVKFQNVSHNTHSVNLEKRLLPPPSVSFPFLFFFFFFFFVWRKTTERRGETLEGKGWVTGAQLAGGLGDPPKSLVMGTRNCKLRLSKTPRNEGLGQVDIYPPSFLRALPLKDSQPF